MQILAIDIGTGTQDILLFDTEREPENALKLVMPSPTQLVAQAIRKASAAGESVLLTGRIMGGGPCAWAAEKHLDAGLRVFATPSAACTFDDDLEAVLGMGVQVVSEDEAAALQGVRRIEMRDLVLPALHQAFAAFQVPLRPDALAVAVFDHGAAPAGYSDRRFRFEYLAARLREEPSLTAVAFMADAVPAHLTRMAAVAEEASSDVPVLLMDTPAAAVLGALDDPHVRRQEECLAVNVGNAHTLAFRLRGRTVTGLFEHHTGKLTPGRLDDYIEQLAAGTLDNETIYNDRGHGALLLDDRPVPVSSLSVTGPRRMLLRSSRHRPYFAVPFGDMMLAGCWGLVRALAAHQPAMAGEIEAGLARGG